MRRPVRLLLNVLPLIVGWILVTAGIISVIRPVDRPLNVSVGLLLGVVLGVSSAWFELYAIPRYARRLAPGWMILVRTVFYAVVAGIFIVTSIGFAAREELGDSFLEVYQSPLVLDFFAGPLFRGALLLIVLASFGVNLIRQVGLMLGPGTLMALFVGRYRVPVREERALLFIDLDDSTRIAQKLGPDRFHAYKNEFFQDIAEPILATGGRIMQYVGDEVLVTWRVKNGALRRSPVETFFRLEDAVASRTRYYERHFGIIPTFKGSLHSGEVVTAEVGALKKDIVHSGDPVNVAARIEGRCHDLGARLLVSEAALKLAALPPDAQAVDVGEIDVRGRDGAIRLFKISRTIAGVLPVDGTD